MRTSLILILSLAAAGCPPVEQPANDDDSTEADPCATAAGVLSVTPEFDAENVYTDTVSVTFDAVPANANLTVTSGGAPLDGTISTDDNDRTIIFTAAEIFPASSTITANVTTDCIAEAPWTFDTGPHGTDLVDEMDLVDRVFEIDLGSANIVEPEGVGALLQGFLTDVYVLFQITNESDFGAGELHVMGALGQKDEDDATVQDLCEETLPLTYGQDGVIDTKDDVLAGWEDPYLRVGPTDLTLEVEGTEATVQQLFLEMLFHPDAVDFVAGRLEGSIDTRPLVGLLDSEDPAAICDLAEETVGIQCEDCGGGEMFCLSLVAEDLQGEMLFDGGLTPRSEQDIADDPNCE